MFSGGCRISDEVKILHLPHAEPDNAGRANAGVLTSGLSGSIATHPIRQAQYNAFDLKLGGVYGGRFVNFITKLRTAGCRYYIALIVFAAFKKPLINAAGFFYVVICSITIHQHTNRATNVNGFITRRLL